MTVANIIKKPVITEKSIRDAQKGIFTFEVDKRVNKYQIKDSIEKSFKVHVIKVASATFKGKKRLVGRKRMPIHDPDRKKAWVQLASGEKIDLFETGERK